jgi:hypothetical protein
VRDEQFHGVVTELLGKRWSPEQVAHELRLHFPGQPERHLCTESIYQVIYDRRTDVTRPAKRRRRRRRVQGLERRGRITNMTMIADRPVEVGDRVQVGHREGDCIMGVGNRSAIGTLVERTTRFVILIHVPTERPTAAAMRDGITDALGALAPNLRLTLTWDQGKELALRHQITAITGTTANAALEAIRNGHVEKLDSERNRAILRHAATSVSWTASSASCGLPVIGRHTAQTAPRFAVTSSTNAPSSRACARRTSVASSSTPTTPAIPRERPAPALEPPNTATIRPAGPEMRAFPSWRE